MKLYGNFMPLENNGRRIIYQNYLCFQSGGTASI